METDTRVLVGTAKGLVVYIRREHTLVPDQIHFKGFSVTMIFVDPKTGFWWVGLSHRHWGQKLHVSTNMGTSWIEKTTPNFGEEELSNGKPASLRQVWTIERGGDTLWMGTDPGGLFRSTDEGETFSLVRGLWDHPSRRDENQWFGAGSDFPFIHSIVVHSQNPDQVFVGVSCAGVFETIDGGDHWEPRNKGLRATYLPNESADVGHDPHWILMCRSNPDIVWQQNHCGVYISKDCCQTWEEVSEEGNLPYYGFALAIDHDDPARAWVIPAEGDDHRNAPDLNLRVYHTSDFGSTWNPQKSGLPEEMAFDIVLRQAFDRTKDLMVFGTNSGNLYQSDGNGLDWILVNSNLSKVNTVVINHLNTPT